ncbi:MAG: HAD family hydrolase [Thainema sp.]
MSELKALIFDVDGTIAETERDGHRVAFNQTFAEAGLNWVWEVEQYGQLLEVPGGKERMQHYINQSALNIALPAEFETEWDWLVHLHKRKTHHYRQQIEQGLIPLRPGVLRLMQEARAAGIQLAIATTSSYDNATSLLKILLGSESLDWFTVIAAGDIVPNKKPAPDIYLYALDKLQLQPEQCLVFEDSAQGLQAAIAAGLTTVVTLNDYTHHHDFAQAALVVNHLGELEQPFEIQVCDQEVANQVTKTYFDLELAQQILRNAKNLNRLI